MGAGSGNQKPAIRGGCGWALFFILALGGAGSNTRGEENSLGGQSSSLQITVQVHDYARVPPTMLEGAERQVAAIFQEAGIRITWAGGAAGGEQSSNRNEPQPAERVADIFVGIITSPMASKLAFPGETLGFSLPCAPDKRACLAYVCYQRIEKLACRSRATLPRVLACAVVHEIGHLLLGVNSHSERGIMRAEWCAADFEPQAAAKLLFTAGQADLIRVHVSEHVRYRTVGAAQRSPGTAGEARTGLEDGNPDQEPEGRRCDPRLNDKDTMQPSSGLSSAEIGLAYPSQTVGDSQLRLILNDLPA